MVSVHELSTQHEYNTQNDRCSNLLLSGNKNKPELKPEH